MKTSSYLIALFMLVLAWNTNVVFAQDAYVDHVIKWLDEEQCRDLLAVEEELGEFMQINIPDDSTRTQLEAYKALMYMSFEDHYLEFFCPEGVPGQDIVDGLVRVMVRAQGDFFKRFETLSEGRFAGQIRSHLYNSAGWYHETGMTSVSERHLLQGALMTYHTSYVKAWASYDSTDITVRFNPAFREQKALTGIKYIALNATAESVSFLRAFLPESYPENEPDPPGITTFFPSESDIDFHVVSADMSDEPEFVVEFDLSGNVRLEHEVITSGTIRFETFPDSGVAILTIR